MNAAILASIAMVVIVTLTFSGGAEVSITKTNKDKTYTPGELIFSDDFDTLDCEVWSHEITLGGNDRWEFQLYENSRKTSFVQDGILHIKPRPTVEEHDITRAEVDVNAGAPAEPCTNGAFYGCWRQGNPVGILNPIISAQLRTIKSFYFQYGRVEIRAKLPGGDWMRPSFSLWAKHNKYGTGIASGQIDIMQSRGNQKLYEPDGSNAGSGMVTSGLYYGSAREGRTIMNRAYSGGDEGYDADFHLYGFEWTNDYLLFSVDNVTVNKITPPEGGFWNLGGFTNPDDNLWVDSRNQRMAPFDQKYFLVMNVAVGGVKGYFGAHHRNDKGKKPWVNSSNKAALEFWEARNAWLPTWEGSNGTLQVDYVRVYAI